MQRLIRLGMILLIVAGASYLGLLVANRELGSRNAKPDIAQTAQPSSPPSTQPPKPPLKLTFVGDIMLDRSVWTKIKAGGADYPYQKLGTLFDGADLVVANLEGPVTERGNHAIPGGSLLFKFEPATIAPLKAAGLHVVSLANNHTRNQGQAGLDDSRQLLTDAGLQVFGDPKQIRRDDVLTIDVGSWKLAFIGWNLIEVAATGEAEMLSLVTQVDQEVDQVIVVPHWGNEYKPHTAEQERLAHALIDHGADLIVGAHAHVVQGVESYRGRPIIYSLGNFIFDQYWSEPTQRGAAAHITLEEDRLTLGLTPVDLHASQPRPAAEAVAALVRADMAADSDDLSAAAITTQQPLVLLPEPLSTTTKLQP